MTEISEAVLPVEIRSADDAQRTATMLVCRYGETTRRTARPERFTAGAFTRSVAQRGPRIPFTDRHTDGSGKIDRESVIARPVSWQAGEDELTALLKFYDTPEGWEAFCRARDGELTGGSVGFRPVAERTAADGTREVTEATLHHVALLGAGEMPAYDAPRLLEVRGADVAALLAVKWDPGLAEVLDPDRLADIDRRAHL